MPALNDKKIPQEILVSLLGKIQSTKKMNTRELKKRKAEKEVRTMVRDVLIFI